MVLSSMYSHMSCKIELCREILVADMTLVHIRLFIVLAPGIIIYLMNTCVEMETIILSP